MKLIYYLLFLTVLIGIFKVATVLFPTNAISNAAGEADLLIGNSRLYAKEHAYERSLHQLELAIETITEIEQELDAESQKTIDRALEELHTVQKEIEEHKLDNTDMNHAFTKTMNALTYAELKITEHFIETDDFHDAHAALKSGMIHIKNALKFADSGHKAYERHIYAEIDSLLQHPELGKKEIVNELEKMLAELDQLVEEE
ncbi:MAG: hypothetical protein JXR03_08985 [Cyclobacteriaceae bacterium]